MLVLMLILRVRLSAVPGDDRLTSPLKEEVAALTVASLGSNGHGDMRAKHDKSCMLQKVLPSTVSDKLRIS